MPYKNFAITEGTSSDINTYLMNQMMIVCTSSTRPSTPVEGMRIWETDTLRDMVYYSSQWRLFATDINVVRKTVAESVNNSASPQPDNELFLSLQANATYLTYCSFGIRGISGGAATGDSADAKVNFTGPSGATMVWATHSPHSSNNTNQFDATNISVNDLGLGGSADVSTYGNFEVRYLFRGLVITAGSSGTLQLNWSQTTATASNTTLTVVDTGSQLFMSTLRAERVA